MHSVKLEFANESHLLAEQEEALPIGEEGNEEDVTKLTLTDIIVQQ